MTAEEAAAYDKMPMDEFRKLPRRIQRAYMSVPLPAERQREIILSMNLRDDDAKG